MDLKNRSPPLRYDFASFPGFSLYVGLAQCPGFAHRRRAQLRESRQLVQDHLDDRLKVTRTSKCASAL